MAPKPAETLPTAADPAVSPPPTIWLRPDHTSRGPKAAHSRDEIASLAVRIADEEGLDAVSMRRVASELGAGTTSLYRYFSKKDELLELMVDAAIGELALPERTGDWRTDLRAMAERERAQLKRHPWCLSLTGVRTMFGPNSLRSMDHSLATVKDLGLDVDDMVVMVSTVLALVHGYVMNELADQEATRRSGLDMNAWMASVAPYAAEVIEGGQYPRVVRVIMDAEGPHAADRDDRAFNLGLDLMLDGFAANLERADRSEGPGGAIGSDHR